MQAHEGAIRVSSQRGVGTTFHLYFPAVLSETDEAALATLTVHKGSGERILYLDDELPLVEAAVKMLRRLCYEVEGYTEPAAALKAVGDNPARYQLIITDLHMPGLSGIEFVQAIRAFHPDVPIVLSSGHLTEDIATRARKMGVTRLMHKPNTLEDFSNCLHDLLQRGHR